MTPMEPKRTERVAVVLIGHGAPATDCPPQLVGELMSLEWRSGAAHGHAHGEGRAVELDATIRNWPRHAGNDPYKAGLERLAEALRPLLSTDLLAIGYNEFCQPSIAGAIADVVQQGATRVVVIPSMLTPGGLHSERDIPRALDVIRKTHPHVVIKYLWPFDLHKVASLLAAHVRQTIQPTREIHESS